MRAWFELFESALRRRWLWGSARVALKNQKIAFFALHTLVRGKSSRAASTRKDTPVGVEF
jgi:hypothetical protein